MKYIDRLRAGAAYYLDQLSEYTAIDCPLAPEEIAEDISKKHYYAQLELCRRLREGIVRLISPQSGLQRLIPARVRALAESQFSPSPEQLIPLFEWTAQLNRELSDATARAEQSTADVAYRLGGEATEFLRAFSRLYYEVATLWRTEDDCALTIPDTGWGCVSLHFLHVTETNLPAEPVMLFLLHMEAEAVENGYVFRFLFAKEQKEMRARLLEADNWVEYSVTCENVRQETLLRDYAELYRSRGVTANQQFTSCCHALLHKQAVLGASALSAGEAELFDFAYVIGTLSQLPLPEFSLFPTNPADEVLDNRYCCERASRFLRTRCGELGATLAALLDGALLAFEDEQYKSSDAQLARFQSLIRSSLANGHISEIFAVAEPLFANACRVYQGEDLYDRCFSSVRESICRELEPFLRQNRFSGVFPNYRRLDTDKGSIELLTFCTDTAPFVSPDGFVNFSVALTVSRCRLLFVEHKPFVGFYQPENVAANSLEPTVSGCKRAEISLLPDGTFPHFRISVASSDAPADVETTQKALQILRQFTEIALAALARKPLPYQYRTYSAVQARGSHLFAICAKRSVLFGLLTAIVSLLIFRATILHTTTAAAVHALFCSFGIGAAGFLLSALVLYLLHRLSFWEVS